MDKDSGDAFRDLDLSGIHFPSDNISIGILRKEFPALFDIGFASFGDNAQPKFFLKSGHAGHAEDMLANLLYCERVVAVSAYAEAKGIDGLDCDLSDLKDDLMDQYTRYNIASGVHHAEQLIRDIERQAAQLAKQQSP